MRENQIRSWMMDLTGSFGQPRPAVPAAALRDLFSESSITTMIGLMQKNMKLDLNLRVGYVNSGNGDVPAWVELPKTMPMYGTNEFKRLQVTLFFRKSFLQRAPFEVIVVAAAHELAHIVLDSVGHPLRRTEEAVDLTAMLLGYRDFYVAKDTAANASLDGIRSGLASIEAIIRDAAPAGFAFESSLGYLTREERLFAHSLMQG